MARLVAIPCLYYVELPDDAAEAAVEAELIRTALDSDAPMPDVDAIRPDMAADITTVADYDIPDNAPTYRVTVQIHIPEATDASLIAALDPLLTAGERTQTVPARNRYEAEQLAVRRVFAEHPDVMDRIGITVTSVRMT